MHQQHVARGKVGEQVLGAAAEALDGRALEPRGEILRQGQRRSPRRASTLVMRAPSITGARPRRTVSTSGNSGMRKSQVRASVMRALRAQYARNALIAAPGPARYGPADKGLFAMPQDPARHPVRLPPGPARDKQALVDDVFRSVAGRYDLMNDLMSGGLHRLWKDALVTARLNAAAATPAGRPFALLDIAGGTGDIALRVAASAARHARHRGRHQSRKCWQIGRDRAAERGLDAGN